MEDVTSETRPRANWFRKNAANLVVLACVLLVVFMQWPAIKEIMYSVTGTGPVDKIAWRQDYHAALAEARSTGKPLLLDFTASWCPPCQVMKREVWPDAKVEELANGRFIPVYIDVDNERNATARFDVSTIPTIIALTPEGEILKRSGFLNAGEMIEFMNATLEPFEAQASLEQ